MARWAKLKKGGDEDGEGDEEMPSESTMSGAMAGLVFLQQQEAAAGSGAASSSSAPASSSTAPATDAGPPASTPGEPQTGSASEATGKAFESSEEIEKLPIKELKQRLKDLGATLPPGVAEKTDLVNALRKAMAEEGPAKRARTE